MREITNEKNTNVLDMRLSEFGEEQTCLSSEFDQLTDVNVLLALLQFYIKLGFSNTLVKFTVGGIELTYSPENMLISILEPNQPICTFEAEHWGNT